MADIPNTPAARAEALRIAEHQERLSALRDLATPLAPPDPVLIIDMRRDQLVETYNRDWQEYGVEAAVQFAASAAAMLRTREEAVGHG